MILNNVLEYIIFIIELGIYSDEKKNKFEDLKKILESLSLIGNTIEFDKYNLIRVAVKLKDETIKSFDFYKIKYLSEKNEIPNTIVTYKTDFCCKNQEEEKLISPYYWGSCFWYLIHKLSLNDYSNTKEIIYKLIELLPCSKCITSGLSAYEYANTRNNNNLFLWSVDLHNYVNSEINKDIVSLEECYQEFLKLEETLKTVFQFQ